MTASQPLPPITSPEKNEPMLEERFYHAKDILSDPTLAASLTEFVNRGFKAQSTNPHAIKIWGLVVARFKRPTEIHDMLGPEGLFAAIYDDGVPVACAGAIPWKYGSQPLAQAGETGWEIKSVTVDPRQAKKGLVSRCIGIVHEYLIAKDSELRKENERTGDGKLRLWIQATEIVNGDYWRRRGYKDVRRIEMPIGYWSAKIPFTMVVLMKELDLDETTESN